MLTDSKALIDTNILVYALDKDSEKHEKAKETIKNQCEKGSAIVSAQNLAEFVFVVTEKKKKLSAEQANQFVFDLSDNSAVLSYSTSEIIRASQLKFEYKTNFFDSLIVATMEKAGVFTIITENEKDFVKINWLKVINPFKV
ncbi:MAG: PIN domain-containing protein [Candidatus Diapherotrites archaeon]|nr:PIN domain-containing protein [Candidatus Diapherotrites archaeon]